MAGQRGVKLDPKLHHRDKPMFRQPPKSHVVAPDSSIVRSTERGTDIRTVWGSGSAAVGLVI